jgi:sporulation protein YqfC
MAIRLPSKQKVLPALGTAYRHRRGRRGEAVRTSLSRRLRQAVANLMEVPKDAIMDLPRITIIGGLQLYVENHKGIVEFSDHRLRLTLSQGELVIMGKQLVVKSIFSKEILIEGEIDGIQYVH